mgnify:FL=1
MRRHNLPTREVSKDVVAGINRVRELFKANKIHIHKSCINLINELETYSYPEKQELHNPNELPIKENDHAVDALRYVLFVHAVMKKTSSWEYSPTFIRK